MSITPKQMIKEIKRELSMRKRVYPGQIQRGKMSRDEANHRYQCLQAAMIYIQKNEDQKFNQMSLFGTPPNEDQSSTTNMFTNG